MASEPTWSDALTLHWDVLARVHALDRPQSASARQLPRGGLDAMLGYLARRHVGIATASARALALAAILSESSLLRLRLGLNVRPMELADLAELVQLLLDRDDASAAEDDAGDSSLGPSAAQLKNALRRLLGAVLRERGPEAIVPFDAPQSLGSETRSLSRDTVTPGYETTQTPQVPRVQDALPAALRERLRAALRLSPHHGTQRGPVRGRRPGHGDARTIVDLGTGPAERIIVEPAAFAQKAARSASVHQRVRRGSFPAANVDTPLLHRPDGVLKRTTAAVADHTEAPTIVSPRRVAPPPGRTWRIAEAAGRGQARRSPGFASGIDGIQAQSWSGIRPHRGALAAADEEAAVGGRYHDFGLPSNARPTRAKAAAMHVASDSFPSGRGYSIFVAPSTIALAPTIADQIGFERSLGAGAYATAVTPDPASTRQAAGASAARVGPQAPESAPQMREHSPSVLRYPRDSAWPTEPDSSEASAALFESVSSSDIRSATRASPVASAVDAGPRTTRANASAANRRQIRTDALWRALASRLVLLPARPAASALASSTLPELRSGDFQAVAPVGAARRESAGFGPADSATNSTGLAREVPQPLDDPPIDGGTVGTERTRMGVLVEAALAKGDAPLTGRPRVQSVPPTPTRLSRIARTEARRATPGGQVPSEIGTTTASDVDRGPVAATPRAQMGGATPPAGVNVRLGSALAGGARRPVWESAKSGADVSRPASSRYREALGLLPPPEGAVDHPVVTPLKEIAAGLAVFPLRATRAPRGRTTETVGAPGNVPREESNGDRPSAYRSVAREAPFVARHRADGREGPATSLSSEALAAMWAGPRGIPREFSFRRDDVAAPFVAPTEGLVGPGTGAVPSRGANASSWMSAAGPGPALARAIAKHAGTGSVALPLVAPIAHAVAHAAAAKPRLDVAASPSPMAVTAIGGEDRDDSRLGSSQFVQDTDTLHLDLDALASRVARTVRAKFLRERERRGQDGR